MNIWEILGIEPTRDQGAVRRAYAAAAAARYNPEEHPEEFLAVRQAYEQALAFARSAEEPAEVPELPEGSPCERSRCLLWNLRAWGWSYRWLYAGTGAGRQ